MTEMMFTKKYCQNNLPNGDEHGSTLSSKVISNYILVYHKHPLFKKMFAQLHGVYVVYLRFDQQIQRKTSHKIVFINFELRVIQNA